MSERILKALMQLFAIIANPKSNTRDRRPIVKSFLKQQLNKELVSEYIKIFDQYYASLQRKFKSKGLTEKKTAASSVKVLTICTAINKELTQKQKLIVVIRLLEFINSENDITKQEFEFVSTVAETFNINKEEYLSLKDFVLYAKDKIEDTEKILQIDSEKTNVDSKNHHIQVESLNGRILIYALPSANMHVFTFVDEKELYLNNQLLDSGKIHILSPGASIKNAKIKPIYYNDIVSTYNLDKTRSKIALETHNLVYKFRNGVTGLSKMNFVVQSGNLVGILGASGSGKSTLLNVLNGNLSPFSGSVLVNGIDIHDEKKKLEGIIGYVSQDDMLIEELTVFQNLYYSAKLCFNNYNQFQILRVVLKLLKSLGLYDIKNMKVGSPLNKKISGGQRKRLNIALELIREPAILFLDEPTSGLSSRDSENILDILKELALKGKLIFVVIHQPSSDIFKRFDKLLVLDKGGHLIYDGDPVESISYFKSSIRQADWNESECSLCGTVNPEQIFNIVEAQVVDEYGVLTQTRKTQPVEWGEKFEVFRSQSSRKRIFVRKLPEINFNIPGKLKQLKIYITRDVLSKLTNKQYMIVNLLETPVLAFILSYITRYYNIDPANETGYNLMENTNLPVYIFMSVIVALFVGMTVSAQEIIKDRMILKRESFVNLSRTSYLLSKIVILTVLSAYQSFVFVLVGNSIMEIQGMYFEYWIVLFSTCVGANLMGLNISDGFKTTVTIYIVIPFLIIPQIILSGIIVKFDNINPAISSPNKIPFYGEMMISRWAYEALAVYQFKENEYEKHFYEYDKEKSIATYKKDFWLKTIENKISYYQVNKKDSSKWEKIQHDFEVVRNEIKKELSSNENVKLGIDLNELYPDKTDNQVILKLKKYFAELKDYYNRRFNIAIKLKDSKIVELQKGEDGKNEFKRLKKEHSNNSLSDFVQNSDEINYIKEYEGHLYQKVDPIYFNTESGFIKAHFYAPSKMLFGKYYSTLSINILVIWLISILMYITLHYSVLGKGLELVNYMKQSRKYKKEKDKKVS